MEIYSTEEQQVEAIKSIWSKYGNAMIGGVVIGLAGIYGWNWYQDDVKATQEAQSLAYQQAVEGISAQSSDKVESFISAESDSGYATLAALKLAKSFVEAGELNKAAEQLSWVIANNKDVAIKDLATYRLARIEFSSGSADKALQSVAKPESEAFISQFAELRGDIYLSKGDSEKARTEYQTAADNDGLAGNPGLKMKLDNLAEDNGAVAL